MQSRCLLQVVFTLLSLHLSQARYVIGSDHSCVRSSPADEGQTRVTFLREDAAGMRSLYLSLWSEDTQPITCEVNTNPHVTETYRSLCDRRGTQSQEIALRFNISVLLAPDAPCALVSTSAPVSSSAPKLARRTRRDEKEGKTRRKRAWIFPGTLWCGTGSRAAGYDQLGMFESADRCCREHDHCMHIIEAFTVNYGVFNPNFFTVSHCDCDQRFRQCLLSVNDTISSMVGYSFFNILRVPCFELEQQRRCTEMYWWGACKVAKKAPYAIFKKPLPYSDVINNTDSNVSTSTEGQHVNKSFVINPHGESTKSEHRCGSRDPPRRDTFYPRRKKGKGCKRHRKLNGTAPSQIPPMSRALTTTPSMKMGLLNSSKSSSLMSNKKRAGGKKSTRKAYTSQGSEIQPQETSNSAPPATSTTQSTPSATQEPAPQPHSPTATTALNKIRKKVPKQSRCCGFRTPLRGDTFQPRCESCLEEKATSHMTTVTPSTTTYGLPIKVTTAGILRLKKTGTPEQDTLKRLWSTSATPATTKLKSAASIHEFVKPQKQMDSPPLQNNTSQEPMGGTTTQSTHAERGLKQNIALGNMTESQRLCGSLKYLDECKYKIYPLEKKYDLLNMESKTAYHCDCTNRLAIEIESLKRPSILPKLLMDFVSQYCFKLPKEKKCHRRKSCSGGFIKASDLLQALKMIEEKDTGVRNSGSDRRRGIPARLYKRCLRLEKRS